MSLEFFLTNNMVSLSYTWTNYTQRIDFEIRVLSFDLHSSRRRMLPSTTRTKSKLINKEGTALMREGGGCYKFDLPKTCFMRLIMTTTKLFNLCWFVFPLLDVFFVLVGSLFQVYIIILSMKIRKHLFIFREIEFLFLGWEPWVSGAQGGY